MYFFLFFNHFLFELFCIFNLFFDDVISVFVNIFMINAVDVINLFQRRFHKVSIHLLLTCCRIVYHCVNKIRNCRNCIILPPSILSWNLLNKKLLNFLEFNNKEKSASLIQVFIQKLFICLLKFNNP